MSEAPDAPSGGGSLAAAVAEVIGSSPRDVPAEEGPALGEWLARRGLGLVPIERPETFRWPGRFLARRRDSGGWMVLFGVPPGIVWPPGLIGADLPELDTAFVIASHELAAFDRPPPVVARGRVELIAIADRARGPMRTVERARALAGHGLDRDRYAAGAGTFSDAGGSGRDLTLVEAEALDELVAAGVPLAPEQARRNLVVRGVPLDTLIGQRFRIGSVECVGRRRCEPCAHLERLTRPGVLRGLVHRGGLRADVLVAGEVRVGDELELVGPADPDEARGAG